MKRFHKYLSGLALFACSALAASGCNTQQTTGSPTLENEKAELKNSSTETTQATLSDQLAARAKASAASAPPAMLSAFKKGIELVDAMGLEESAKQVGDTAIDGELTGWKGDTIKLSELWNEGPVVLMWYRGGWCPYCNIQLRAMQKSLNDIENAGAKLVVLTPELPEKAKETAEAANIEIVALHDKDNALAKQYGIMFDLPEPIVPIYRTKLKLPEFNGSDKMQLPLAATYVIDKSGKITYAFLDADYKKRAEPADVVAAVKAIAK